MTNIIDGLRPPFGDGVEWSSWQKRFALKPVKVNGKRIWLKTYYVRIGRSKYIYPAQTVTQYGTLFDVLKTQQNQ